MATLEMYAKIQYAEGKSVSRRANQKGPQRHEVV